MSQIRKLLKVVKSWNTSVAVCVRRPAVLSPKLTKLEKDVSDLYDRLEFENSYLSVHELKLNKPSVQSTSDKGSAKIEEDLLTSAEKELIWEKEAENFKPANNATVQDIDMNTRSTRRLLDQQLVLFVQNDSGAWNLPTLPLENNQTLREGADIIFSRLFPTLSGYSILGNCPSAVHVYKDNVAKDCATQVYFFNFVIDRLWDSQISNLDGFKDFSWFSKAEIQSYIKNKDLLKSLNSLIINY